jgi:hypothetical protein
MRARWRFVTFGFAHLAVSTGAFLIALDGSERILKGNPVSPSFRVWQTLAAILCFPVVDGVFLFSASFPSRSVVDVLPFLANSAVWALAALFASTISMRKALELVAGVAAFGATLSVAFFAIGLISARTQSGLLGICGPYGSDQALWSMLGVLALGVVGAPVLGIRMARVISRHRA